MRNLRDLDRYRDTSPEVLRHYGWAGDHTCGAFLVPSVTDGQPLRVIASAGEGWDHVSVSRRNRCPNWPEMKKVYEMFLLPDEVAMQLHLPTERNINHHRYCLHIWRPHETEIPLPDPGNGRAALRGGLPMSLARRACGPSPPGRKCEPSGPSGKTNPSDRDLSPGDCRATLGDPVMGVCSQARRVGWRPARAITGEEADMMTDTNRTGATLVSLFALPLLLVASCGPAWAAQAKRHGVGWESRAGSRIQFAQTGGITPPCNSQLHNSQLQPQHDPWTECGDPEARIDWHSACSTSHYLRVDDPTGAEGVCYRGGFGGASPHGIGAREKLIDLFAAGELGDPSQWDGEPNWRELTDTRNSAGEWQRLLAAWYALPNTPDPPSAPVGCQPPQPGSGWSTETLSAVPAAQRPPEAEVRDLNAGNSQDECRCWRFDPPTWWGSPARLTVNFRRPECFPPSWPPPCRVVEGLTADCWESEPPSPPEPEPCGDGLCDVTVGEDHENCPEDCVPPPSGEPMVELTSISCDGGSWVLSGELDTGQGWEMSVSVGGSGLPVDRDPLPFRFTPDAPCADSPPPAGDLELVGVFCHEPTPGDWRYLVRILTEDLDLVDLVSPDPAPLCAARELVCVSGDRPVLSARPVPIVDEAGCRLVVVPPNERYAFRRVQTICGGGS